MNLTSFLKQIDELTEQYPAELLRRFIHDYGRALPEGQRTAFLDRLRAVAEKEPGEAEKESISAAEELYQKIMDNLEKIENQEVTITRILNEEYDDWYDHYGEEFFYEDKDGVSQILTDACVFIHDCLDREMYQEGFDVGSRLLTLMVLCESDYGDEELSIADMSAAGLLDWDTEQTILDTLCCTYHVFPREKRPWAFYEILSETGNNSITFEAMAQHSSAEFPDFQDFLKDWIEYCGARIDIRMDRFLGEAVTLLDDFSAAAAYARKLSAYHPGIYLRLLEDGYGRDPRVMTDIGLKAVEEIPKKYVARGRAALYAAKYVIRADVRLDALEQCYFAAYESDTTPVNFFRVFLHGYDKGNNRKALSTALKRFDTKNVAAAEGGYASERLENWPDTGTLWALRFLDGQFSRVLSGGLGINKALGWSGTFMKQGIALFLLYLYEGDWNREGIRAMADLASSAIGFSAEKYGQGLRKLDCTDNSALFYQVFSQWKSKTEMPSDVREQALNQISRLLETRTEGIMAANRRNYYGECAAYIAALGEVQESIGKTDAKQWLMNSYKNKYPRRRAFRDAMESFGWRG